MAYIGTRRRGLGWRGLGDAPSSFPQTILGQPIWQYCSDSLKWVTNYYCWSYSPSAWGQMMQFANQPLGTMPKPPGAVTNYGVSETVPPTVEQAAAAVQAATNQAIKDTQAANLAQSQSFVPVCDADTEILDPTSNTCVPIPPVGGLSMTTLIAIGLAAGVGLIVLTSGGGGGRRRR